MAEWNFDMSKAPRGRYRVIPGAKGKGSRKVFERAEIIVAGPGGVVTVSYFIPEQSRWNMFMRGQEPMAWMPYAGPRQYVDDKGRTRYAVDLPPHPTMAESWFETFMRERKGTGTPAERQRECLDWIAARSRIAA